MTARVDDLVRDYLDRLGAAAAVLPPDRRADLLDGIAEHIDGARAAGAAADEAAVRTLLDRLGSPEEIVAAAQDDGPPGPPVALRPRGTGRELAAVLMLTAGSFVPLVGWFVGVVLLWTSPLWRVREKLLGTLVWPFGPGGFLVGGAFLFARFPSSSTCVQALEQGGTTCSVETGGTGWPLALLWLGAPVVVAVVLYRLAVRRARELPPVPVVAGPSPWGAQEVAGVALLGLGGLLLPLLLPLVGLVLVLSSPQWRRGQKALAATLALAPLLLAAVGVAASYLSNGSLLIGPMELGLLGGVVTALLGPLLAAAYLLVVLSRRT